MMMMLFDGFQITEYGFIFGKRILLLFRLPKRDGIEFTFSFWNSIILF